ncbi:Metallo-hydrolase/oxidoreductase [Choiromyces venosus 120613-1]|uniref:Metallo-hydrolase/oxidoreductase n=1 Tax=Choiromyces venosus 120613-1 TaxID=1336337 RepID=A0A3N4JYD1_9PEZI|nr:Metallo-hydrolase/oxidoreductase [Choiromyces venosus 120613-1]
MRLKVTTSKAITPFKAYPLNPTTLLIVEQDANGEGPNIIVKRYPQKLLIIDTGPGGLYPPFGDPPPPNYLPSLRTFLECVQQPWPSHRARGRIINPGGRLPYGVAVTHHHFDHIGGTVWFPDSLIGASARAPGFILAQPAGRNSLNEVAGIPYPEHTVGIWLEDGCRFPLEAGGGGGMVVMHTPGHTPDSITLWDEEENTLFTGDLICRGIVPNFFPGGASIADYLRSVDKLITFVDGRVEETGRMPLLVPGHTELMGLDGISALLEVRELILRVLRGEVKGERWSEYGFDCLWFARGEPCSVFGPDEVWEVGRRELGLGLGLGVYWIP